MKKGWIGENGMVGEGWYIGKEERDKGGWVWFIGFFLPTFPTREERENEEREMVFSDQTKSLIFEVVFNVGP